LDGLKGALLLLGVKQCCWCSKYFLCPDVRALFDADELVCYGCIQEWWQHRCPELSIEKRQAVEHKLLRWLVSHHDAKVIRQTEKLPQRIETQDSGRLRAMWRNRKERYGRKMSPLRRMRELLGRETRAGSVVIREPPKIAADNSTITNSSSQTPADGWGSHAACSR